MHALVRTWAGEAQGGRLQPSASSTSHIVLCPLASSGHRVGAAQVLLGSPASATRGDALSATTHCPPLFGAGVRSSWTGAENRLTALRSSCLSANPETTFWQGCGNRNVVLFLVELNCVRTSAHVVGRGCLSYHQHVDTLWSYASVFRILPLNFVYATLVVA